MAPKQPKGLAAKVVTHQADLSDPASLDALFASEFGHPDVVYSMHGIMSLGSEGASRVLEVLRRIPKLISWGNALFDEQRTGTSA